MKKFVASNSFKEFDKVVLESDLNDVEKKFNAHFGRLEDKITNVEKEITSKLEKMEEKLATKEAI